MPFTPHDHPRPATDDTVMPEGMVVCAVSPVTPATAPFSTTMLTDPTPPADGIRVTFMDGRNELGLSVTSTRMGSVSGPLPPEMLPLITPSGATLIGWGGFTVTRIWAMVPPGATA